jgi:hypothetical protein
MLDFHACKPLPVTITLSPSRKESRFRALISRNSLTITPPHFRLGSILYASRESREQQRQRLSPQPSPWLRDDNFETPRRSFGAASGSSAQRFEAPSGPPNSVALTARIALNFGTQNQAWAWVLAIPLTGPLLVVRFESSCRRQGSAMGQHQPFDLADQQGR